MQQQNDLRGKVCVWLFTAVLQQWQSYIFFSVLVWIHVALSYERTRWDFPTCPFVFCLWSHQKVLQFNWQIQINKIQRTKNKQTNKKIQQQKQKNKKTKTVPQQYLAEVPFKIISLIFAFQKFEVHYEIRQSCLKWSRCAQGDYTEGEIGHILI